MSYTIEIRWPACFLRVNRCLFVRTGGVGLSVVNAKKATWPTTSCDAGQWVVYVMEYTVIAHHRNKLKHSSLLIATTKLLILQSWSWFSGYDGEHTIVCHTYLSSQVPNLNQYWFHLAQRHNLFITEVIFQLGTHAEVAASKSRLTMVYSHMPLPPLLYVSSSRVWSNWSGPSGETLDSARWFNPVKLIHIKTK